MASLPFPDSGTRMVLRHDGRPAVNSVGLYYGDAAGTAPAEIYADVAGVKGALISGSTLTTDTYGQQRDYWGPVDGTDRLWVSFDGGPLVPVDADYNARIDAAVAGSETPAGAQAKADAAQAAAIAAAASDATTKADTALTSAADRALSNLSNAATARTNLGLGTAATRAVGTVAGTVTAGDDNRVVTNAAAAVRAAKLDKTIAHRGVNLAGAEFGTYGQSYGTYRYPTLSDWTFTAGRGFSLARMPFMWERLQPTLSGPLDATELGHLQQAITDAGAADVKVVLDLHNFATYGGLYLGATPGPTLADFTDIWVRLSTLFRDNPTVVGYGLMNEPRSMPTVGPETGRDRWLTWSQAVLTAIRGNADATCVMVGGYSNSSVGNWFSNTTGTPTAWITDPLDNFMYECHHYWDSTNGTYANTYAQELTATSSFGTGDTVIKAVQASLKPWIDWLRTNNARGFVGEFGWPRVAGVTDSSGSAQWNECAEQYLRVLDATGSLIWTAAWASSSAWASTYNLRFYLNDGFGNLATAAENAATLEAHKPFRGEVVPAFKSRLTPINFAQRWRAIGFDIVIASTTANLVAGQVFVSLMDVVEPGRLEQVVVYVNTAAAGPTAGQCAAGLYDAATGAQIAVTGDIGASLTSTGFKGFDLTTPTRVYRPGERIYAALLFNGTTPPNLAKAGAVTGVTQSLTRRWGLVSGAATVMPASLTLSSLTLSSHAFWFAAAGY